MDIVIRDENFILHPSKALYWVEEHALLIADLHIGKVQHFRKSGIAVPQGALQYNFDKLDELIQTFTPDKILFLGDLFHSDHNEEWYIFTEWLERHANIEFVLIRGNHDRTDSSAFPKHLLERVDKLEIRDFTLTHQPLEGHIGFNFCGHIHPGIMMKAKAKTRIKLPCFAMTERQMILPAFGVFTGLHLLSFSDFDQLYVSAETEVFKIK